MELFLDAAKRRIIPWIGWIACSALSAFVGGNLGILFAGLCLAAGFMETTDQLFTGWGFLTFPFVGGIVGLIVMHIVRVQRWVKLHRKYMEEYKGWTHRHTIAIVFIDETVWLLVFAVLVFAAATAM